MYGKAFDIDGATCSSNKFFGHSNEAVASYAAGQDDLTYARPQNVDNFQTLNHTTRTTGDRNLIGGGASWKRIFSVDGTMPQQNNNAGTITAGDADNKVIFRFPQRFTKINKPNFFAKLKVFAYGAFGNGMGMVEVDFGYSMRNQTTSAAELSVFNVNTMGDEITGLYFLTGVAASDEMGVALVGGNYGAFAFANIRCELEVCVFGYGSDAAFFSQFTDLTSTTTADVTANDVTDAIDLLTVATTSV